MDADTAPKHDGSQPRATARKWVVLGAGAACVATIAVVIAVNRQDDAGECRELRHQIERIEQDVPIDAAQAWDDIYDLQDAVAERERLRQELRALRCG